MDAAIRGIEDVIGYTFNDTSLAKEALCAAGSNAGGGRRLTDGNKSLAVLGDTILSLAVGEEWYKGHESRGDYTRILQQTTSNNNLCRVAEANDIGRFVVLPGAQRQPSPALLATTVEAVVGAVYLDAGSMHAVKDVMRALGMTSGSG